MTGPLPRSVELLERSLGYTRTRLAGVRPPALVAATPCAGWDLLTLLVHMEDALDAFLEAAGGVVALRPRSLDGPPEDLGARLQTKACALLGVWAEAADAGVEVVEVGGTPVPSALLVQTAALEILVHGWDVGMATGEHADLPPELARDLLPVAAVVVVPADRGVRFGHPVRVPAASGAGHVLLAHLGRSPRPPGQVSLIPRTGT